MTPQVDRDVRRQMLGDYLRYLRKGIWVWVWTVSLSVMLVIQGLVSYGVLTPWVSPAYVFPRWVWWSLLVIGLVISSFTPFVRLHRENRGVRRKFNTLSRSYEVLNRPDLEAMYDSHFRGLPPIQRRERAREAFDKWSGRAMEGDAEAVIRARLLSKVVLDASAEVHASTQGFQRDAAHVNQVLEMLDERER